MWDTEIKAFIKMVLQYCKEIVNVLVYIYFLLLSFAFCFYRSWFKLHGKQNKNQGKQIIYLQSTSCTDKVFREKYILCATLHETLMGLKFTVWSTKDYFMHIIDKINWMRPICLIT